MLDNNIRISDLQVLLDKTLGKDQWLDFEPETIILELGGADPLVLEKIYVLKALNMDANFSMSFPEFILCATSVINHEPAEFEILEIPTCLELAWAIEEVKRVCLLTGQKFQPTQELKEVVAYILKLEGFSKPIAPFDFIDQNMLEQGQTEQDTLMKQYAITGYINHMRGVQHA